MDIATSNVDHRMKDVNKNIDDDDIDEKNKPQEEYPTTATTTDVAAVEEPVVEVFQQPPLPKFQINQRVDCLYKTDTNCTVATSSPQWYDAIIRKMKLDATPTTDGTSQQSPLLKWLYFIHYQGWNSRYDQWCTEDAIRISSRCSTNITRPLTGDSNDTEQQHLQQRDVESFNRGTASSPKGIKANNSKKRSRSNSPVPPSGVSDSIRRAKRPTKHPTISNDTSTAARHTTTAVPAICTYTDFCQLPMTLQIILYEEKERIVGVGMDKQSLLLHQLPGPVPIRKVIQHFVKRKIKEIRKMTIQQPKQEMANDPESIIADSENKLATKSTALTDHGKIASNNGSKRKDIKKNHSNYVLTEDIVRRFGRSLQELFEQALPKCLLYPQERSQYINKVLPMIQESLKSSNDDGNDNTTSIPTAEQTKKEKMALIDIYGCEYLLRLYVRLPMILEATMLYTTTRITTTTTTKGTTTSISNDAITLSSPHVLGPLLSELLVVLQKNRTTLFPTKNNYYRSTGTTVYRK